MCRRCFASGRVPAEAAGPFSLDACKLRRGDFPCVGRGPRLLHALRYFSRNVFESLLTNKVVNGILMMTRKVVKMKRIIVMTSKERCIWDLRIA